MRSAAFFVALLCACSTAGSGAESGGSGDGGTETAGTSGSNATDSADDVGSTGGSDDATDPDDTGDSDGTDGGTETGGTDGEPEPEPDPQPLAMVDAGETTACGIDEDGALWCWGAGEYGQLGVGQQMLSESPVRVGEDTWRSVEVGFHYTCGIKTDDTLWCWGWQMGGAIGDGVIGDGVVDTPQQVGDATWQSVSASHAGPDETHTCGVQTDGTLWCWGQNYLGQLGDGTELDTGEPVPVGEDTDWTAVSCGLRHTCGIKEDGSVWCWGNDVYTVDSPVPVEVVDAPAMSAISAGHNATCGIATAGTLHCWGLSLGGSFGFGPIEEPVTEGDGWVALDRSDSNLCVMRDDDTAWCFFDDGLFYGSGGPDIDSGGFVELLPPDEGVWTGVTTGNEFTCGTLDDGTARCFGKNFWGQLGNGRSGLEREPVTLTGDDWDEVLLTPQQRCGVRGDALWCWHLGSDTKTPADTGYTGFSRLDGGHSWGSAVFMFDAEDTMYGWGATMYAPDGGSGNTSEPTVIEPGETFLDVGIGRDNACAVRSDRTLWCWGANYGGVLGVPGAPSTDTPIQVGTDTDWDRVASAKPDEQWGISSWVMCGVRTDGSLWCWGNGVAASLVAGMATPGNQESPGRVGTANDWVDVVIGPRHVCGLTTEGALRCAGDNDLGQLGDPARGRLRIGTPTYSSMTRFGSTSPWISMSPAAYETTPRCGAGATGAGRSSETAPSVTARRSPSSRRRRPRSLAPTGSTSSSETIWAVAATRTAPSTAGASRTRRRWASAASGPRTFRSSARFPGERGATRPARRSRRPARGPSTPRPASTAAWRSGSGPRPGFRARRGRARLRPCA